MKKLFSGILAAVMLAGLLSVGFASAEPKPDTNGRILYISNEQEFADFADSCRLDSWSERRTVILTEDITLTSPIDPIPSFSGTLYGKNHSISGLSLKGKHSRAGLFGILTNTALVTDLRVSGKLKPSGTVDFLGGIAAVNDGRIIGCSFSGDLKGEEVLGGIAGYNGGIINNCTSDCTVRGQKEIGGIAGFNDGKILNSSSSSSINLHVSDEKTSLKDLAAELKEGDIRDKVRTLLTIKQVSSTEDIGGIAGYSCGSIENCSNTGKIGKEGVGYNVGGIAGRSCGYIMGSTNSGNVFGREYVGGIAGLAEPSIAAVRDGDVIDPLRTEVNKFLELVSDFTYDMDNCADDLSGKINELAESVACISDSLTVFEKEIAGLVNGKIREVNAIKGLAADALENVAEVTDNISGLSGRIAEIVNCGTNIANLSGDMIPESSGGTLTGGYVYIVDSPESCEYWANHFGIEPYSGTEEDLDRFRAELDDGFVAEISTEVNGLAGDIKAIADGVHSTIDSIAGIGNLGDFSGISDGFNKGFAGVMSSIRDTMENIEGLSTSIDNLLKTMTDTVRVMTGEISYIINGLFDAVYDFSEGGFSLKNFYYTNDDYKTTVVTGNGVVSACANSGTVKGSSKVGGIAGAQEMIGIPDFVSKSAQGLAIVSFCYTDLLQHCVNTGDVVAHNDCAGLISGSEELGAIFDCQAYGSVQSRKGSYVGGITGFSNGVVEDCFVKAAIRAADYAGGIMGSGDDSGAVGGSRITDCLAQIEIYSDGQFVGGISGTEEGEFSGNVFINDRLNGVDDFSLSGKAEPAELSGQKVPEGFSSHEIRSEAEVRRAAGAAPVRINLKLILIAVFVSALILLSLFIKYATFFIARKIKRETAGRNE